jgi:tetratricopeptide (TPR) repeat protein
LAQLRQNLASQKGDTPEALRPLLQLADTALNARDADASKVTSLSNNVFKQWDEALQQRNVNNITLLLNQLQVIARGSADTDFLRTHEVESRLKSTVELARQHKSERQKVTVESPTGAGEYEIPNSEQQSAIESANLLSGAAMIYAARKEVQEAEKLFKEAISLEEQDKVRPYQDLNSIMSLAELYEDSGRIPEAENVYKKALTQLGGRWGEQSSYVLRLQEQLGRLFERQGRWEEAEQSYQLVARLSQSGFGADSIIANSGQETLATFLFQRGRYAEAIPLLEPLVGWYERRRQTEPWLIEGSSLWNDYLQLAKSYYYVGRHDAAESAFRKASDLISAKEDADLFNKSDCLVWQWFTANALKKPDEATRFYQELLRLIQAELAQPHPNEFIGSNLQDFAKWFRDAQEFSKSEELLRLALAVQEKVYGTEKFETGLVWGSFGYLDIERGRYKSALVYLKTAQSIYEKQSPSPVAELSYVLYRIGFVNYSQLDFEQARVHLTRAAELFQQAPESDNFSRYWLGRVERRLGHFEAAKKIMMSVLDDYEKAKSPAPSNICSALLELASIARLQGEREEANQWLARAQKASEGIDPVELRTHWSLFDYEKGMLALGQGKSKEAVELLRIAVEKGERNPQMDQPLLIEYMDSYARVMRQRGNNKEAVSIEQRANKIRASLN